MSKPVLSMENAPVATDQAHAPPMRLALAGLALSMLLSSLGTSIASVGLPNLALVFGASFEDIQWVVLAYLLSVTTLIVGVGRLGDLVGRRRLLLAGVALFTAASVLCGIAPTLGWLIAARAAQGLGAAVMMALVMALVGDTVPKARTGSAMGVLGTMSALGTMLGPSLGGVLIAGFGWPAMFFVNVPLGVAAFVLVRCGLPAFVQTKAAAPSIRLTLLRDPVLGAGIAANALVSTVMMTTLVVGPFYLSRALALDTAMVGLVLSAGPLVSALSGVPAGRLVDRFGAQRMSVVGLTALATGASTLAMLPTTFGVTGYLAGIAVVTAGYALFQAANNTAVMSDVRADQRGVVSGLLNLSRNLGLITGASAMGALFAFAAAARDVAQADPAAVATGMRTTFAVAAGLVVVALIVVVRSRRRVPVAPATV